MKPSISECGKDNEIKPKEAVSCRTCGHKILYKKRTKRSEFDMLRSTYNDSDSIRRSIILFSSLRNRIVPFPYLNKGFIIVRILHCPSLPFIALHDCSLDYIHNIPVLSHHSRLIFEIIWDASFILEDSTSFIHLKSVRRRLQGDCA
jgi:DNA-directed RNA polymerase subunit RPC12/RpoP